MVLWTSIAIADIAPPPPSGDVVTGAWEFVHLDGSIKSGTWAGDTDMQYTHRSHDGEDYAITNKLTGCLSVWWDMEKKRPFQMIEFLNGLQNGFAACWNPNGSLHFIGRLHADRMASGMWWRSDGTRQADFISDGEDAVSIDRKADGTIKRIEKLKAWMPHEKPQPQGGGYSPPAALPSKPTP